MIRKQHHMIWLGQVSGGVLLAGGTGPAVFAGSTSPARPMRFTPIGGTCPAPSGMVVAGGFTGARSPVEAR